MRGINAITRETTMFLRETEEFLREASLCLSERVTNKRTRTVKKQAQCFEPASLL
jgi:hypothetical protein